MILTAMRRGADHYRLHAGGREIGWVNGHAFGFCGFRSLAEGIEHARHAYATLGPWLQRQRRTASDGRRPFVLGVEPDGDVTWLTTGEVRIGRVVPVPCAPGAAGDELAEHSYELWLPRGLGTALVLSAARQVYAASVRRAALAADAVPAWQWPAPEVEELEARFATSG